MDKKTKIFIAVFAAIIVVCSAAWFLLRSQGSGTMAVITIDGEVYKEIDLSKVKKAYDIEIDTEYGHNTVHVEQGSICVSDADCPDRVCINEGSISTAGVPIICMPHRLVITISGGDLDA